MRALTAAVLLALATSPSGAVDLRTIGILDQQQLKLPNGIDKHGIGVPIDSGVQDFTNLDMTQFQALDTKCPKGALIVPYGMSSVFRFDGINWMPTQTDPSMPAYLAQMGMFGATLPIPPNGGKGPELPHLRVAPDGVGLYNSYVSDLNVTLTGVTVDAPVQVSLSSGEVRTFVVSNGQTAVVYVKAGGTTNQYTLQNGVLYSLVASVTGFLVQPM